uniref:Uncharacterized protein n=1 Tax=Vitis vinifera TaxID=29760 RepID=A5B6M0_VITVI|nr:hypothetical protein VITISV_016887 [Vitis vinifera]
MVLIRGCHTNPSASCETRPSASIPQDSSQASQAPTVPSSEGGPSVHRIPPKTVRTSGPEETSRHAQPDSQGLADTQHLSGIAPEAIIKRPMVTAPPIKGNSDCRAKSFHFELYFDIEAMRHQRIQQILDSGPLYLNETWSAFYREGPLKIHTFYHLVQRQGPILDALFRISEGFYFGPHHLIMAALLYFKKKVHRKKLQRADTIPLLFPRLLCHILEHMGYPTEPYLERRHHCREHFTLDQWTQLASKNPIESIPEAAPHRPASPVSSQAD